MEIKRKVEIEDLVDIQCDVCGKSCKGTCHNIEFATLSAKWGYESNKDLTEHECHMCEECFDKVRAFIESQLRGKVREYYYDIWDGHRLDETKE